MHAMVMALALSAAAEPQARADADQVVAQAFAVPLSKTSPESSSAPIGTLLGWGLAASSVVALLGFALRRRKQGAATGYAELAQNLSVGPKRSLLVVAFGNKRMLVGSTEHGFNVLATEPIVAGQSNFDAALEQQLQAWAAQKQGDAS